ncbi:pimeloyl-ACP methyl ester carboxylesterase [Catenulispora sp. MAP5-51]|uniref:alpha/beta fold hydrolase n=1 Tax=Catenulispora sp. MAP5-51 TaxID=3156298 RepID=UPI0035170ED4
MANIQLRDVATWYEVHGDGESVLLLHSGFVDSRMFAPVLPFFVDNFRVYTVDRRGHGRTPDVEGPLTYEAMADDTIAFLDKVVGEPAHLVGHSDGANVALLVALKRPDLVRKLVLVSGTFHYDGNLPGTLSEFDDQTLSRMSSRHGEVSPDGGENFPVIARKVLDMAATEPTLTSDDLRAVAARTLVIVGDDDTVSLEHTIALYRGIPDSELAIVPGTSHLLVIEKPDAVYSLTAEFLTTQPTPTLMPIRRATSA